MGGSPKIIGFIRKLSIFWDDLGVPPSMKVGFLTPRARFLSSPSSTQFLRCSSWGSMQREPTWGWWIWRMMLGSELMNSAGKMGSSTFFTEGNSGFDVFFQIPLGFKIVCLKRLIVLHSQFIRSWMRMPCWSIPGNEESQMVYLVASMMCIGAISGLSSQQTVPQFFLEGAVCWARARWWEWVVCFGSPPKHDGKLIKLIYNIIYNHMIYIYTYIELIILNCPGVMVVWCCIFFWERGDDGYF